MKGTHTFLAKCVLGTQGKNSEILVNRQRTPEKQQELQFFGNGGPNDP